MGSDTGGQTQGEDKLQKQQGMLLEQWEAGTSWGQRGKQRKLCPQNTCQPGLWDLVQIRDLAPT